MSAHTRRLMGSLGLLLEADGSSIPSTAADYTPGKTRAIAQAYRALRVARHYVSREALEWDWQQMEREGAIVRDGRQYRTQNGGAA